MNKDYYVDGNVVRKTAPEIYRENQEKEAEKRRRKRMAQKNFEKANKIDRGFAAYLTGCMLIVMASLAALVYTQSKATSNMLQVAKLESELAIIRANNDSFQQKIETNIDMERIRQEATSRLGMVSPKKEQILYFEINNDNYMNQQEDIPNN